MKIFSCKYLKLFVALSMCTLLSWPSGLYKSQANSFQNCQKNIFTLAPNSRVEPVVSIKKDPLSGAYMIAESPEETVKIKQFNREETAFVYLSYLIGDVLYKYSDIIDADTIKELIKMDLSHIDFQKYLWEEMYQINRFFYLPFLKEDGSLGVLQYSLDLDEQGKDVTPYSFVTEDGKGRITCKEIFIENRKQSIKRTLQFVERKNDDEVDKELNKRLRDKNVLFLSFRLDTTDLDGVSLEAEKWAETMKEAGANIFYYSGQTKQPKFAKGHTFRLAHFLVKEVEKTTQNLFQLKGFSWKRFNMVEKINENKKKIKNDLKQYIIKNNIEYMVFENVLSYPGNVSLSLAAMEVANEMDLPVIAHNHDFYWERKRFRNIREGLKEFFNGIITNIKLLSSTVICKRQIKDLEKIGRADTILMPNVMNYDKSPKISSEDRKKTKKLVRDHYGMEEDELFLLAPVRPVARKFLKRAVKAAEEIARRYGMIVNVAVTHPAGDELDGAYWESVKQFAENYKNVRIIDASTDIKNKVFSLEDSYAACDLVIYSSNWEGWGNVVAEAVYYRKPVIIYPYRVYREDIKPTGVDFIEMIKLPYEGDFEMDIKEEEYLNEPALSPESMDRIIHMKEHSRETVDQNFKIFKKHFSYSVLKRGLLAALENIKQIKNRINYEEILIRAKLFRPKVKEQEETEVEPEYWLEYFKELLIDKWMTPEEISQELHNRMGQTYNGALMIEYLQKFAYMKILNKDFNGNGQPIYILRKDASDKSLYEIMLYGLSEEKDTFWLKEEQLLRNEQTEKDTGQAFFSAFIKAQQILREEGCLNKKIAIAIQTKWIPKVMEESIMKKLLSDRSFKNIAIITDRDNGDLAQKIIEEKVLPENVIVIGPENIKEAKELAFLTNDMEKRAFFAEVRIPEEFPKNAIDIYYPLLEVMNISLRYAFGDDVTNWYPNVAFVNRISERIIQITPFAEKMDITRLKKRYDIQAEHIDIMA